MNRHRSNTNSTGQRASNVPSEATTRSTSRFYWTDEQERTLFELYDHAIAMNNYTLKDPHTLGREYMVEKFNLKYDMNVNYGFFKNKLDDFKKAYKKWKFLMKSTGIGVDPGTSWIDAPHEWWEAHESGCKITRSFGREPPKNWDLMQRCLVLHDVYSQPQQSSRQRREEILTERRADDGLHGFSDADGDEMPQNRNDDTDQNEEVYRVNIDEDDNFIKISNFSDADFAEVMAETGRNNTDEDPVSADMEASEIADGEYITQIRDNIANMYWQNQ